MTKFDKTCPECGSANAAGAVQCTCGYLFNPLYREDPRLALELAVREEKLIEEYLTARLEQAIEGARAAAQRADVEQDDARKAVEAAIAQLDAQVAQAELSEQRARVSEAETRLEAYIAEKMDVSGSVDTATTNADQFWQTRIVAGARKAKSAPAGAQSTKLGAKLKAKQAAKAERAIKAASDLEKMKCPSCGASITVTQTACRCGWSIPKSLRERKATSATQRGTGHATRTDQLDTKKPTKPR